MLPNLHRLSSSSAPFDLENRLQRSTSKLVAGQGLVAVYLVRQSLAERRKLLDDARTARVSMDAVARRTRDASFRGRQQCATALPVSALLATGHTAR